MQFLKYSLELLGIILIIVLIDIIFIPNQQNNNGMTLSEPEQASSSDFINGLSHLVNTPVKQGEAVTVISQGPEFLTDLTNTINNASSSINFTTYPWSEGTMSDQVLVALTQAARRGVAVRILIDALGGHTISNADLANLKKAGAKIERYHQFTIFNPLQYNERDHMRSIVIDGKIGFIGGMGIGDDWLGDGVTKGWSDTMFEVKGEMAESLQNAFAVLWNETTGEVLAGSLYYPQISTSTVNNFVNIVSVPSDKSEPIRDTFLYSIMNAQKDIYIISPFIIPDSGIVAALENKARSGVNVEIISPGDRTNAPLIRDAWRSDYDGLLAAGVKIFEYEPEMIHTKIMVVDDIWSVIGSANIDSRSESINNENIMGIQDPTLASQLETLFAADLNYSNQITKTEWASKSSLVKIWYESIKIFAKQL